MQLLDEKQQLHRLPFDRNLTDIVPGSFVKTIKGDVFQIAMSDGDGGSPFIVHHCDRVEAVAWDTPFTQIRLVIAKYSGKGEIEVIDPCGVKCKAYNLYGCWHSSVEVVDPPSVPKTQATLWLALGYRDQSGRLITGDEAVKLLTRIWSFCKVCPRWQSTFWCEFGDDFPRSYTPLKIHWRRKPTGELYPAGVNSIRVDFDRTWAPWDRSYQLTVKIGQTEYPLGDCTRMQGLKTLKEWSGRTLEVRHPEKPKKTLKISGDRVRLKPIEWKSF